jgi:hypothetical protein
MKKRNFTTGLIALLILAAGCIGPKGFNPPVMGFLVILTLRYSLLVEAVVTA